MSRVLVAVGLILVFAAATQAWLLIEHSGKTVKTYDLQRAYDDLFEPLSEEKDSEMWASLMYYSLGLLPFAALVSLAGFVSRKLATVGGLMVALAAVMWIASVYLLNEKAPEGYSASIGVGPLIALAGGAAIAAGGPPAKREEAGRTATPTGSPGAVGGTRKTSRASSRRVRGGRSVRSYSPTSSTVDREYYYYDRYYDSGYHVDEEHGKEEKGEEDRGSGKSRALAAGAAGAAIGAALGFTAAKAGEKEGEEDSDNTAEEEEEERRGGELFGGEDSGEEEEEAAGEEEAEEELEEELFEEEGGEEDEDYDTSVDEDEEA